MRAAVVMIDCARDRIQDVAREVAGIEGVAEAYSVSGPRDVVAIVRVTDWDKVATVVTERMVEVDGIEDTETLFAFRVYSEEELDAAYSWD
jgi:DNA-binding Lrp family transcriptional regulator